MIIIQKIIAYLYELSKKKHKRKKILENAIKNLLIKILLRVNYLKLILKISIVSNFFLCYNYNE